MNSFIISFHIYISSVDHWQQNSETLPVIAFLSSDTTFQLALPKTPSCQSAVAILMITSSSLSSSSPSIIHCNISAVSHQNILLQNLLVWTNEIVIVSDGGQHEQWIRGQSARSFRWKNRHHRFLYRHFFIIVIAFFVIFTGSYIVIFFNIIGEKSNLTR